jgi:hypothetical protein
VTITCGREMQSASVCWSRRYSHLPAIFSASPKLASYMNGSQSEAAGLTREQLDRGSVDHGVLMNERKG